VPTLRPIFSAVLCLVFSLCAIAADHGTVAFSSLPTSAQAKISAALGVQLAKLIASDGVAGDQLGSSVAICGDTVVVGAPSAAIGANLGQGAVYVFVKPQSGWANLTQTAKITSLDGQAYDGFGLSVAINGDTVVVGAPFVHGGFNTPGAAYVFVGSGSNWTQVAELAASDPQPGSGFGTSVATTGDTVLVGAYNAGVGKYQEHGASYVFVKPSFGWSNMTQTAKLTASDGAPFDQFGLCVAISGNTVAVGARDASVSRNLQGAAYVFVKPVSGWTDMTENAKLLASDPGASDYLGWSVVVYGDEVIAGAPSAHYFHDVPGPGAAYVFLKPTGGWVNMTETAKLTASDGQRGNSFGVSVAMLQNVLVVGAPQFFSTGPGSAYVFVKPASGWKTTSKFAAKLVSSDGKASDSFGYAVGIAGGTAVAGALGAAIGPNQHQGAAYVFGESQ
jgi:hypothetical protein